MDHRHPVFKGGVTSLSNLQILCRACHDIKSSAEKAEASRLRHAGQSRGHGTQGWLTHADKDRIIGTLREEIAILRGRVIDLEHVVLGARVNA